VRNVRRALILTGLAGLLMLAACGKEEAGSASPAGGSPATAAASAGADPSKSDPSKLGPFGYGGITLGQSAAEVKAAGVDVRDPDAPCSGSADIKGPNGYAGVSISAKYGVYLISARDPIPTPEGIKIGSTLAEVKKAYPEMTDVVGKPSADTDTTRIAAISGNPKAHYNVIMKDGKVDSLYLRLVDCTD
jgi:hypothetical protein